MAEVELQQRLLADLHQFAELRHARWAPQGLMNVRQILRERLASLGPLEEHSFSRSGEDGVNLILKLPGQQPRGRAGKDCVAPRGAPCRHSGPA